MLQESYRFQYIYPVSYTHLDVYKRQILQHQNAVNLNKDNTTRKNIKKFINLLNNN